MIIGKLEEGSASRTVCDGGLSMAYDTTPEGWKNVNLWGFPGEAKSKEHIMALVRKFSGPSLKV